MDDTKNVESLRLISPPKMYDLKANGDINKTLNTDANFQGWFVFRIDLNFEIAVQMRIKRHEP